MSPLPTSLAMNINSSYQSSQASSIDDNLQIKLLLSHEPDGRMLDSEQLLFEIEQMFQVATAFHDIGEHFDTNAMYHSRNIEFVGLHELQEHMEIIDKISPEMLRKCSHWEDPHKQTMIFFDLLRDYRWDAKITLVLTAIVAVYVEISLMMELRRSIPLAESLAMLRKLPGNMNDFKPQLKALRMLVMTVFNMTKCIIKFEALPLDVAKPDMETLSVTKVEMYSAAYWIIRSMVTCFAQITSMKARELDQVYHRSIVAAWELMSFQVRLNSIYTRLVEHVDTCHQQIDAKLHQMLLNVFKETSVDNQGILHMLFSQNNDLPLKDCPKQVKRGLSELKDKLVILLVSKPKLLAVDDLLILVQQTYDHTRNKNVDGDYEIVWVAISDRWTEAEMEIFNFFLHSLPWYSIIKPWTLKPAVVNFIKQQCSFEDKATMIVLDPRGLITNSNALDMVMIWGSKAYPFSVSRENDLWEAQHLNLHILTDNIEPLLAQWVEERRNICLYGSDNIDWIRQFNDKVKQVKSAGVQVEMVYVGKNKPSGDVRDVLTTINNEMHASILSFTAIKYFWLRLESMRDSKLRLGKKAEADPILAEVTELLDMGNKGEGWALFGGGPAAGYIRLQGREVTEWLNQFPKWGGKVRHFGLADALRDAIEPTMCSGPCNHTDVVPYSEGLVQGTQVCPRCKRVMKKFIIYESSSN